MKARPQAALPVVGDEDTRISLAGFSHERVMPENKRARKQTRRKRDFRRLNRFRGESHALNREPEHIKQLYGLDD